MATETKIARVAFMDRGVYSGATEYNKWDFVTTEDSTYLYTGETSATGKPVTDTAYWKCIADGKQATEAAGLAEDAATTATTAAGLADDARLAIQDDLALKADQADLVQFESDVKETTEKPTAQSLSELNARVETLEALIENAEFSKIQTEIIDVISEIKMKGSPLIYVKDEAPSFAPDQLPQFYIDTAARKLYTARGTDSVSDWF